MTGLAADPVCKEHLTGPEHPEQPARFDAALSALQGLDLTPIPPRLANHDELALVHARKYIQLAEREIFEGFHELSTGDTVISPKSYDAALRATGGALNAIDAIADKRVSNAISIGRPPGHHATPVRGMGFCIFNTVAIAARYAQKKHGAARVLIADWDVHHGNGTQDTFYSDGSVFFFSTHQSPWYPGTGPRSERGEGKGEGMTLNCPFPAGAGRKEILGAFQEQLIAAADEIKPEFVLISAGFDSRTDDPLGRFTLSDKDFADLTGVMCEIADKHAGGRLLSVLEGGYSLTGLASGLRAHVEALK
ncbi:MAG TPA: histone deacetylase [Bryobacteraceae bacterium]|nr:histone deacetylase [Bryobacteraceae bacterium]